MGLHPNTARFHLEALEAGGLVVGASESRTRPGRPRRLFAIAPGVPDATPRSYRLLAEILSSFLADTLPDPQRSAEAAGVAWGRMLAEPVPSEDLDPTGAAQMLAGRLKMVGFESHVEGAVDDLRLEVNHCPFLEVAEGHRDVVCAVHLGLMRGMLEQSHAPLEATSLEPLVEPSRCIAHLAAG